MNGIGKSLVEKINEIISTGTCKMYENVKDFKDPKKVFEDIHAVGPKKAKELIDLGFKTVDDLKNCKNIKEILKNTKVDEINFFKKISLEKVKEDLKELTNTAFKNDIFGAPSFVVNNKIFWGQDRLDYALDEYHS